MRRAAAKGDGWLPQGPPEMGMKKAVQFIKEHRAEARGDEPIDMGVALRGHAPSAQACPIVMPVPRIDPKQGEEGYDHPIQSRKLRFIDKPVRCPNPVFDSVGAVGARYVRAFQ